ncbi:hypothetical protein [Arcicella rosea]|uniref:Uncharacterized protein n=1 Tax=Arcicella rosea TaxID=502909 RepID=A0A841EW34_9BACT|nr:hypothetical protein [Arcicella rosea]MBB6005283.1 hypothetical protein [Arcicella rosea]
MKFSESLQKILPFGYLFLVVMGILKESVFYYQIGINILKYSTIMDILISPIATLTAHPIILIALILVIVFAYALPTFLSKQSHKSWVQKISGIKSKDEVSSEELSENLTNLFIKYLTIGLLAFFLGIGIGEGIGLSKKIKSNNLVYKHKLNYSSGDSEQVYLINTNSVYYFYLAKGNKAIKIAPIGAIKSIELTDNKMLK